MDILDVITSRRSVREYKKDMPSDVDIGKILEAGRWAPSGLNNQPWRFMVLREDEKDGLCAFTKYGDIIKSAPVAIVILLTLLDSYNWDKDVMAVGACIENMMLEAHSLGLGTCWLGEILNQQERVVDYLGLGRDFELMAVMSLGYRDEDLDEATRKPLSDLMINTSREE